MTKTSTRTMLSVKKLVKTYGDRNVVDGVSFDVKEGEAAEGGEEKHQAWNGLEPLGRVSEKERSCSHQQEKPERAVGS